MEDADKIGKPNQVALFLHELPTGNGNQNHHYSRERGEKAVLQFGRAQSDEEDGDEAEYTAHHHALDNSIGSEVKNIAILEGAGSRIALRFSRERNPRSISASRIVFNPVDGRKGCLHRDYITYLSGGVDKSGQSL